ncbi:MAG: pyridoxal 5'-phosphate synthase [Gammaproteobacteria bacterium]|nr:pyridoxal 5'-phosphate synthase [Gammaproteobacteria bacterium]MDH3415114.1 pyridoxal 5'-phosphate synthase [Gammaproteobacteria bacterium]
MGDPCSATRLPTVLPSDPMDWAKAWLDEAVQNEVQRNPNSMAAVTVNSEGQPSARVVLCKEFIADPGYLVFYTNYNSDKVRQIVGNNKVALLFHWDSFGRQVRIEGQAVFSPDEESDTYFASRDWGSQLGAWGSDQSSPLESRSALIAQVGRRAMKLGVGAAKNLKSIAASDRPVIPRPPHWGGIRVWASCIELWIEGTDRIHDRARWTRSLAANEDDTFNVGEWKGIRLQP